MQLTEKKPGKWLHSKIFEDVEVAHDEGLSLSSFQTLRENDRAFMIARKRAKGTMEAWEAWLAEQEHRERERKGDAKTAAANKAKRG